MKLFPPQSERALPTEILTSDIVVVGGGVAGVCFAIAAAREGASVVLAQDRPVLGGNASSEVRLWMNGATSHGYNNNRWSRESGVMNEILMHNIYRNQGGNPHILDTVFLDMVLAEPNITLLLNTSVYCVEKDREDSISEVRAFNSQNETFYDLKAGIFCDASGDGVVGFLAGAAFRVGAEAKEEFDEPFAPDQAFGELLGHSIYFYTKDEGRPVDFVPPSYALKDVEKAIPRYRHFKIKEDGCMLWWIEFGGRLDTIFETEKIKWELWKVVYGVWNYFKNSGKFPEAANLSLEWVGTIPGKRESRRFEGDYMLCQKDVIQQRRHEDDVAYGGWALDLHPADGIYGDLHGCTHSHAKGPYPVPYRTMYSRNISNLFLAGRIMSCSHVSFGSLRNMASLGYCGQAAGIAAALCVKKGLRPADLSRGADLKTLQATLLRNGQHIRGLRHSDPADLVKQAKISASSEYALQELPADGEWLSLQHKVGPGGAYFNQAHRFAQMLPLAAGPVPSATFLVRASRATTLQTEFRVSEDICNYSPELVLAEQSHTLEAGVEMEVTISCPTTLQEAQYGYYVLVGNEDVEVRCTTRRMTGVLALFNHGAQNDGHRGRDPLPASELGVETFGMWSPRRRPDGHNFAFRLSEPVLAFGTGQVGNGLYRPTSTANAWVADPADPSPAISLEWSATQSIRRVVLDFDPDWDHTMESVMKWHPDRAMPFTVRDFQLETEAGEVLVKVTGNYLARHEAKFEVPVTAQRLVLRVLAVNGDCPAAVFGVGAYE